MRVRSDKTSRVIVEAAKQLFLENGYDDTSLDHIARVAGTAKKQFIAILKTKRYFS